MVIYFMDEHGGNVQATLFLEYSQEALSIWTSEVVGGSLLRERAVGPKAH